MKNLLIYFCVVVLLSVPTVFSQEIKPTPNATRPRVIVVGGTPTPNATPSKSVKTSEKLPPTPIPTPKPAINPTPTPLIVGSTNTNTQNFAVLTLGQIKSKLAEAKREMSARPITIAMTDETNNISPLEMVRVAFYDRETKQLDYVVLTKEAFLTKDSEFTLTTTNSKIVKFRTIRPNGVNTPVFITDLAGRNHLPLMVQYPVVRNGVFYETAYYMSTHPGLVTPEVITAGKFYIRNTIDTAREKLRQKGIFIAPKTADIAERLCIVEHVDHYRFRTEYHPNIYNDIFTLFALNEGQTYRYSVSSAGAGGLIQMIPSTYRIVRSQYPSVGLMPDFVGGMQNHGNAAQAMLLYIQMTYNDLISSSTVVGALESGIATEFELMSAGYNSNPAKLPGYIKRGGANWKNLIPRETQIYLQINASLDRFVPISARSK